MSGCSFYDVTTLAADAAFGTGLFSDEYRNKADWNGLWDPETSQCIRDEKALRPILQKLDASEDGKDNVILPNGENYPIENRSLSEEAIPGPTLTCLSRAAD